MVYEIGNMEYIQSVNKEKSFVQNMEFILRWWSVVPRMRRMPGTLYLRFIFFSYMFPRALLSPHFWSLQQRVEFALVEHREKLTHFRPVFRNLQAYLDIVEVSALATFRLRKTVRRYRTFIVSLSHCYIGVN